MQNLRQCCHKCCSTLQKKPFADDYVILTKSECIYVFTTSSKKCFRDLARSLRQFYQKCSPEDDSEGRFFLKKTFALVLLVFKRKLSNIRLKTFGRVVIAAFYIETF